MKPYFLRLNATRFKIDKALLVIPFEWEGLSFFIHPHLASVGEYWVSLHFNEWDITEIDTGGRMFQLDVELPLNIEGAIEKAKDQLNAIGTEKIKIRLMEEQESVVQSSPQADRD